MDIYGQYKDSLEAVMRMMAASMERYAKAHKDDSGELIYEHLRYRLKSEKSMQAKLEARGLPLTPYSALCEVRDAIGFRVVCRFIDDIYKNISRIKKLAGNHRGERKGLYIGCEIKWVPQLPYDPVG